MYSHFSNFPSIRRIGPPQPHISNFSISSLLAWGGICSPVDFKIPHRKIAQFISIISINTPQCGHGRKSMFLLFVFSSLNVKKKKE